MKSVGDYNSIEAGVIRSEKITKIPEKKTKIFINLKSLRFPSIAALVSRTKITQNPQNFLQNYF
ncbi:hypothetical protein CRS_09780 [Chryseobacterium sp. ON_d1]|nr:hypothetical protein CRS_09780 [Chryseobacterium sp. ON_d1]